MIYKNNTFLVLGLSKSGVASAKLLLKKGARVGIYDDKNTPIILQNVALLKELGGVFEEDIASASEKYNVLVLSPGVAIDNPICVKFKRAKKRIIGELELGYIFSAAPIIAVTGTNGKTTVCTLIDAILKKAKKKSYLVGNVGTPLSEKAEELNEEALAVTEVSSFQLESVFSFTPHIAVILNITPDHLDRHYSMENYVFLKRRLLNNMRESETAVLNYDDEIVKAFGENSKYNILYFSSTKKIDGAYIEEGAVYFKGEKVLQADLKILKTPHGRSNALAAVAVCKLMGISNSVIASAIDKFKGVKHRLEKVAEINSITYFNDSKSTNPDSSIKATQAMTLPTVIILGGKDKNIDYTAMFKAFLNGCIVHAVLFGENRYKLLEAAKQAGFFKLSVTVGLAAAVKIAQNECPNGGAVLFSPASASFDMFSNFEERGNCFEEIVRQSEKTE